MNKFDFYSVPRILFGGGQFSRVGELTSQFGRRAFIVYNGSQAIADRLIAMIDAAGIGHEIFRQHGEPKVQDIDAAIDLARRAMSDVVIGLGGGSAIDAAKAVAGLISNGGSALDYMEVIGKGQKLTRAAAPWIAIPTTAGTGAEATRNAVIGAPERRFKASIRGEQLLARVALIDPELGVTTPPNVTASSGMDALCQCIESYTSTGAHPMTDALALRGITLAARSLRRAYSNGDDDLDAREAMAMTALLSGIALTNAGLGAVHGFAAPLGANFPAPHGTICAALLPGVIAANVAWLRAESEDHPVLGRYATIGRALSAESGLTDPQAIDAAILFCVDLSQELHIPPLGQFRIAEADVPAMVELAKKASSMRFNPATLSDAALNGILSDAL
ncbi:MAG TPA: iron-containing alcohol dehydrogenase [Tepidisphaeraceae bacterium]|jgi:alcohol dehydrogenase class IV|nr:iron-containing alcohol dehydrogenase [Tepidisphaeraceae bacterium]